MCVLIYNKKLLLKTTCFNRCYIKHLFLQDQEGVLTFNFVLKRAYLRFTCFL